MRSSCADNLDATTLALAAAELAALDRVSALPFEYPGWMIARQAIGREPPATPRLSAFGRAMCRSQDTRRAFSQ